MDRIWRMQSLFLAIFWIFILVSDINLSFANGDCFHGKSQPSVKEPENLSEGSCAANTHEGMVMVRGGIYEIGTDEPVFIADGESPARTVYLDDYFIDTHEVSNQDFADFVEISNFVTEAEKYGSSFVFEGILSDETKSEISKVVASAPWWMPVVNASWKFPEGPNSSITGFDFKFSCKYLYHLILNHADKMNHPAIHISWNDAVSFCDFYGKRLPSEAEWEVACQGGLKQRLYPWGNKLNPYGKHW